jgi:hypothetical protein
MGGPRPRGVRRTGWILFGIFLLGTGVLFPLFVLAPIGRDDDSGRNSSSPGSTPTSSATGAAPTPCTPIEAADASKIRLSETRLGQWLLDLLPRAGAPEGWQLRPEQMSGGVLELPQYKGRFQVSVGATRPDLVNFSEPPASPLLAKSGEYMLSGGSTGPEGHQSFILVRPEVWIGVKVAPEPPGYTWENPDQQGIRHEAMVEWFHRIVAEMEQLPPPACLARLGPITPPPPLSHTRLGGWLLDLLLRIGAPEGWALHRGDISDRYGKFLLDVAQYEGRLRVSVYAARPESLMSDPSSYPLVAESDDYKLYRWPSGGSGFQSFVILNPDVLIDVSVDRRNAPAMQGIADEAMVEWFHDVVAETERTPPPRSL